MISCGHYVRSRMQTIDQQAGKTYKIRFISKQSLREDVNEIQTRRLVAPKFRFALFLGKK